MLAAGPWRRPKDTPPERPTSCPRGRRTVRLQLLSRDDPDDTDHCRWAFAPLGWSCETVEPARDACLGPVMSPDVTFPERVFPTCPRGRRSGRYSLMSRDGPDGTNHCRRAFHPLSRSCETVEPARDACLGPGMSPEVTATAPSSWLRRSASRPLHFELSARARRYIRLLPSIGEAEDII